MSLLGRIELYLTHSAMPAARFGRLTLGDPCFVFELRTGRQPKPKTIARVSAWLDCHEGQPRWRWRHASAAAELRRLARISFAGFGGELKILGVESRSWASIGITGERHVLRLRLRGEGANRAAEAFLEGLAERDFKLRGHILADIALVSSERDEDGARARLWLEALTMEAD